MATLLFSRSDIFYNDPVTVYYLPGTMGWNDFALLTGVPTAPWLPAMQTSDSSFGVRNNQFVSTSIGPATRR